MKSDTAKNLIVITGAGCNGKTYVTKQLSIQYMFYSMHIDSFYSPLNGQVPNSVVGVEDEAKIQHIESLKESLIQNNILEGSYGSNDKELAIWVKYLGIDGDVIVIEVKNENCSKWLLEKHGEGVSMQSVNDYYQSMANIPPEAIVTTEDDVINFLKQKDGILCIPRPHNN